MQEKEGSRGEQQEREDIKSGGESEWRRGVGRRVRVGERGVTVVCLRVLMTSCQLTHTGEGETEDGKKDREERRGEESSTFILEYYVSENDMRSTN